MSALLLGPHGQVTELTGPRGVTPACPEAKFKPNDVVRVRRLKHLRHLPDRAVIVGVVPPGFSADWAWADLLGLPRPLMRIVPVKRVQYIVAFKGNPQAMLMRESYFLPSNEPPAEIKWEGGA